MCSQFTLERHKCILIFLQFQREQLPHSLPSLHFPQFNNHVLFSLLIFNSYFFQFCAICNVITERFNPAGILTLLHLDKQQPLDQIIKGSPQSNIAFIVYTCRSIIHVENFLCLYHNSMRKNAFIFRGNKFLWICKFLIALSLSWGFEHTAYH